MTKKKLRSIMGLSIMAAAMNPIMIQPSPTFDYPSLNYNSKYSRTYGKSKLTNKRMKARAKSRRARIARKINRK